MTSAPAAFSWARASLKALACSQSTRQASRHQSPTLEACSSAAAAWPAAVQRIAPPNKREL